MTKIFIHTFSLILLSMPSKSQNNSWVIGGGTTTITIVTPDTIWMAADSKKSYGVIGKTNPDGFENKILHEGDLFFMIAGLPKIDDEKGNSLLNFDSLFIKIAKQHRDIDSVIHFFKLTALKRLYELLALNPSYFSLIKNAQNHSVFISVSVSSNFNQQLKNRMFEINFVGSGKLIGFSDQDIHYKAKTYFHPVGFVGEIYKIINMPGFSFDIKKIKESLIYMINLEASQNPKYVGGTVDVIKIYNSGSEWLTNNHY
jgi:hypothetical protein